MKELFFKRLPKCLTKLYNDQPVLSCVLLALTINFIIELSSRHSLIKAAVHMCTNPLIFIYNTTIIFLTLSISFLFKKKNFIVALLSVLWISLGILNCILLFFRSTPLSLVDFMIVKTAVSMLPVYLNVFEIILVILWVAGIIASGVFAWFKLPKHSVKMKKAISLVCLSSTFVGLSTAASASVAAKKGSFAVLSKAYEDLGFVYCFSRGIFDNGIDKPTGYSPTAVDNAVQQIALDSAEGVNRPNILIVQLESFFDVSHLKNYMCSENPTPNFTALKENCSSGIITVPSMGGGTANTEFEVLTGMNLDYFGVGEYPYQTILKDTPCDGLPYILREKGYKSTAIHNHTGTFYNRNIVYSNLGFDRFVPVEYMNITETNELGWAKDNILTNEIMEAMRSTEEKDFVFTVTMQSHGKYPKEALSYDNTISAYGFNEDISEQRELKYSFEYYINQIHQVDTFIGNLLEALKTYPEPVTVVFYGDHLPALEIDENDLEGLGIYQTEYCIWSNYTSSHTKKDLQAYQLSSFLLNQLNLEGNLITKLHLNKADDSNYEKYMHLLSYDMLYGDKYCMTKDIVPTQLKLGLSDIKITSVDYDGENVYIRGENFTPFSHVLVYDKKIPTTFIDSGTLAVASKDLKPGCSIAVAQINKEIVRLGVSDDFIIPIDNEAE